MKYLKPILAALIFAAGAASVWHSFSTWRECDKAGGVAVVGIGHLVCVAKR